MDGARSRTPPQATAKAATSATRPPLTLEQVRRIEINRLKAKAIREQRSAGAADQATPPPPVAGRKRPHAALGSETPATARDGGRAESVRRPHEEIQPAKNFGRYVEYDFSKMTDTKGGFLTQEDDPHNRALHAPAREEKPANMTLAEWQRQQLLRSLKHTKAGPFEPGISALKEESKQCVECQSREIDWTWEEVFGCRVCNACKEKRPDKYSLLTKTEAKEDYLLTDPELRDAELLPHLERPNPHKSTWNNMMLYLRCQIESYAFSPRKWGSPDALDAEFTKRETDKKRRKEDKREAKLRELKKRTRVEAHRRRRGQADGGAQFGDDLGRQGKHQHDWGRPVDDPETGIAVKTCIECGMEVEELEF